MIRDSFGFKLPHYAVSVFQVWQCVENKAKNGCKPTPLNEFQVRHYNNMCKILQKTLQTVYTNRIKSCPVTDGPKHLIDLYRFICYGIPGIPCRFRHENQLNPTYWQRSKPETAAKPRSWRNAAAVAELLEPTLGSGPAESAPMDSQNCWGQNVNSSAG